MMLLDTCVLLWLASDQKKLSAKAKETIKGNADGLFISAITAFEIAIKHRNGKLELPLPARTWLKKAVEFHGIHEVAINSDIAVTSLELPPHHNDPCDRLIVATAMQNSMSILTCDPLIAQYEDAKVIW